MSTASSAPRPTSRSSYGSLVVTLLFLGATAAGLRNALAPEPELEARARAVACATPLTATPPGVSASPASSAAPSPPRRDAARPPLPSCLLQTTMWEAGPLGRVFEFADPRTRTRTRVQCRREHIALGDYQCLKAP